MIDINRKISTNKADLSLTPEGHILINIHENAEIDASDIKEINEAKNKLAENKMYTVIFVAPFFGNITVEARALSASNEVYRNAIAKGIVVKSFSARLISSFFIKVNKPPAPTKMFKTESEAEKWLTKMKKEYFLKQAISG